MSDFTSLLNRIRLLELKDPPDSGDKVVPFPPERVVRTPAEIAAGEEPQIIRPTPRGPDVVRPPVDEPGTGITPGTGGRTGITPPSEVSSPSTGRIGARVAGAVSPELFDPNSASSTATQPKSVRGIEDKIIGTGSSPKKGGQETITVRRADGSIQTLYRPEGRSDLDYKPKAYTTTGQKLTALARGAGKLALKGAGKVLIPRSVTGAAARAAIGAVGAEELGYDVTGKLYDEGDAASFARQAYTQGKNLAVGARLASQAMDDQEVVRQLKDKPGRTPEEEEKLKAAIDRLRTFNSPPQVPAPAPRPPAPAPQPAPAPAPQPAPQPAPAKPGEPGSTSRLRTSSTSQSTNENKHHTISNYLAEFERYIKRV